MAKNVVSSVLNFVLKQYMTTERFREGLRSGTRASFHMDEESIGAVLKYVMQKNACTVEAAVQTITKEKNNALQQKARNPKEAGFFSGLLLSLVAAAGLGIFAAAVEAGMWVKVVLTAAVLAVFFALLLALAWSPRLRAMKAVWKGGEPLADKLEKLHEVQEASLMEVIGEYQKPQGVIFAIVALACVLGIPAAQGKNLAEAEAFHKTMSAVTVSADNAGTRYVVYDADEGMYIDKYLSDTLQARSAEEVRAVVRIQEGKKVVGRYEGQGNAYQRYVTIELVDQRTGAVAYTQTVYGGDPPDTISVKSGTRNQNGYGSRPTAENITKTIEAMIARFEAAY